MPLETSKHLNTPPDGGSSTASFHRSKCAQECLNVEGHQIAEHGYLMGEHEMDVSYKRLWVAVLKQAVEEALGRKGVRLMKKAQTWLQNDNQTIGSFLWICAVLQLDPQSIRNFFKNPD